mmetsp:Transcript_17689/g.48852  ORF Transcript_17689/g.48852 Transcript_17689/m.48852 type:complete len:221 (-) Transcript_17689:589-1251(-)
MQRGHMQRLCHGRRNHMRWGLRRQHRRCCRHVRHWRRRLPPGGQRRPAVYCWPRGRVRVLRHHHRRSWRRGHLRANRQRPWGRARGRRRHAKEGRPTAGRDPWGRRWPRARTASPPPPFHVLIVIQAQEKLQLLVKLCEERVRRVAVLLLAPLPVPPAALAARAAVAAAAARPRQRRAKRGQRGAVGWWPRTGPVRQASASAGCSPWRRLQCSLAATGRP